MIHDDSPVHGYGHRDGSVHGGGQLVVSGLQQADVAPCYNSHIRGDSLWLLSIYGNGKRDNAFDWLIEISIPLSQSI